MDYSALVRRAWHLAAVPDDNYIVLEERNIRLLFWYFPCDMSTPEDLPTRPTQQDNCERINPLLWSCNLIADRCKHSVAIHATFLVLSHYKTTGKDNGGGALVLPVQLQLLLPAVHGSYLVHGPRAACRNISEKSQRTTSINVIKLTW